MTDPTSPFNSGEVAAAGVTLFWDAFIRPVVDTVKGKVVAKVEEHQEHKRWIEAAEAYRASLIEHVGTFRILGKYQNINLDDIYTHVFVHEEMMARHAYELEELQKSSDQERAGFYHRRGERKTGMGVVNGGENLFVVGKPGAGKTTFLRYITLQAARRNLSRVPIFISLNAWANSPHGDERNPQLLPFIARQFEICHFDNAEEFIIQLLKSGKALLLFDGLDEVKQENEQRRKLTRLLQDFSRQYDKSQHIITCRIAAIDYRFERFRDVEMADFDDTQVRTYVNLWFGEGSKKGEEFLNAINLSENQGVRDLCNVPLLLSLICLFFADRMRFPPNRGELYEKALDLLLDTWDSNRDILRDEIPRGETIYRELSTKRKSFLFASVAAKTFEKGHYFFRRRQLEEWITDYLTTLPNVKPADAIDSKAVLKAIEAQHGIFVERAQDIYSFSHLTFQEYYAACFLVNNRTRGSLQDLIDTHLADSRWREVFLLTAGLVDEESASEFFRQIQHDIDGLILNDPTLLALLTWADSKAKHAIGQDVGQSTTLRLTYIFLTLVLSRSLACNLDGEIASLRELAHELDGEIVSELELAYNLAFARNLGQSRGLARNLAQSSDLTRNLAPSLGLDYGLYYAWAYAALFAKQQWLREHPEVRAGRAAFPSLIDGVAETAQKSGAIAVAMALADLPNLSTSASAAGWQKQADRLFELLIQRDLVQRWTISDEQINTLNHYFAANELLVQCLKVAVVSDRQAVLDRLLSPPG